MITSIKFTNKLHMVSEMTNDSRFQLLEYDQLNGAKDVETAFGLQVMKDSGVKLKQIRIILEESAVKVEAGALSYLRGDVAIKNKMGGVIGLGKKFISSKLTGEEMFKPLYQGSGEIFLEPSFGHFALVELEDEEIIVDDGMFLACEDSLEIGVSMQKKASAALFGNEGLYQTRISGSGIVVLEIPVPETEIFKCTLFNDTLKVDGNFAILRTANVEFSIEKSASSIIGSATSGEGLLNVYRGTGQVWLIPTNKVYENIKEEGFKKLTSQTKNMDNEV